jgi:hypothetical protein
MLSNLIDADLYQPLSRVPTIEILQRSRRVSAEVATEEEATGFTENDLMNFMKQVSTKQDIDILPKLIGLRLALGLKLIALLSPVKQHQSPPQGSVDAERLSDLTFYAVAINSLKDRMGGPSDPSDDKQMKARLRTWDDRLNRLMESHPPKVSIELKNYPELYSAYEKSGISVLLDSPELRKITDNLVGISVIALDGKEISKYPPPPMDLDTALRKIKEYLIEPDWLDWFALPENEIIQLYDSNLHDIVED